MHTKNDFCASLILATVRPPSAHSLARMPPATPARSKAKASSSSASKRVTRSSAASPAHITPAGKGKRAVEETSDIRTAFGKGTGSASGAAPKRLRLDPPAAAPVAAPSADAAAFFQEPQLPPTTTKENLALQAFDMEMVYGPQCGPTRMQRWRRAEKLGLKPPAAIFAILKGRTNDDPALAPTFAKYAL